MIESYDSDKWQSPYTISYFYEYQIALKRDTTLRFPAMPDHSKYLWDIAIHEVDSWYGRRIFSKNLFEKLLLEVLNSGQVTPDRLSSYLQRHGFQIINMLKKSDLAGEGLPGWVFRVSETQEQRGNNAIFALVLLSDGRYELNQLYSWSFVGQLEYTFEIIENAGSGQPGILIIDHFWCSGGTTCELSHLYLYVWDDERQQFINLAQNIPTLEMDEIEHVITYLDPPRWTVGTLDPLGTPAITSTVEFQAPAGCLPPTYQTIYLWDGKQYQWAGEGFLPVDPAASLPCQASWALQTGRPDSETIDILQSALADGGDGYTEIWGKAAKDYLHLQLGIFYALSGQRQQALFELIQVRDQPEHPEYAMASQLAGTFIKAYSSDEIYQPCKTLVGFLNDSLVEQAHFSINFGNLIQDSALDAWGILDPRWIWDGSPICNEHAALQQSLQFANPQSSSRFAAWLNRSGIEAGDVTTADFDGNGIEDWLVPLRLRTGLLPDEQRWEVWLFLRDLQAIIPIHTAAIGWDLQTVNYQELSPGASRKPVGILHTGSDAFVFEVRRSQEDLPFFSDSTTKVVYLADRWVPTNVSTYKMSEDNKTLTYYDQEDANFYSPIDIRQGIFHWEAYAESYVLQESLPSPQEQVIQSAEQAIFETHQPAQAVTALEGLLAGEIIEDTIDPDGDGMETELPVTRPYALYLLALAYELSGDEANAVQAYWQLWHDFPENPYALLARRKLIPN